MANSKKIVLLRAEDESDDPYRKVKLGQSPQLLKR
jgi:hypothetical protein